MKTWDVIYSIVPDGNDSEAWGAENYFEEPLVSGSWKKIVDWFNKGEE